MCYRISKSLTNILLSLLLVLVSVPSSVIAQTLPPQNEGVTQWILSVTAGGVQDNFNLIQDSPPTRYQVEAESPTSAFDTASAEVIVGGVWDLTTGPAVVAHAKSGNGSSVNANAQATYVIGADVLDFSYTTAINYVFPPDVFVAFTLGGTVVLSDYVRNDGTGIIPGEASFIAEATINIPGVSTLYRSVAEIVTTHDAFGSLPPGYEDDFFTRSNATGSIIRALSVRPGERIQVQLMASANYFGNTYDNQAPNGQAIATADPLFWFDPDVFYEFENGDIRPASDFFQLSVSPGINVIGPEGGLPSYVAGLPDINSNGFADIAVTVPGGSSHVHVRDGNTGELISDIVYGDEPIKAMAVIDDISGNGMPEIAVLGTRLDNNVRVQVNDSETGTTVNSIFYGSAYTAVDMTVLPDTDANGADELLVVGTSDSGGIRVQARDALSDAPTSTTYYGTKVPPQGVVTIPDVSTNGEPEVLIHGRVTTTEQGRAQMRDSATRALLRNFNFGSSYVPIELAVIQDVSGDGIPDLAQLARRDDTGQVRIQTKRTDTGETIANAFTGSTERPITVVGIGDANGNSAPDVALLMEQPDGMAHVIVRDGATGAFIRNIFAGAVRNPMAMALVDDLNMSGDPELAILGDNGAGTKRVQIKDSISGAQVNTIDFP